MEQLKEAEEEERKTNFSEDTKSVLEERRKAVMDKNVNEYERLTKLFKKSKEKDKRESTLHSIRNELDIRSRWLGIKRLRSNFNPQPYNRTDKNTGIHIHTKERAQKAAEYLGEEQWGTKETEEEIKTRRQTLNKRKIVAKAEEKYRVGEITKKELKMVIKKLKRRKAPGPDEIPTDIFKEMDEAREKKLGNY